MSHACPKCGPLQSTDLQAVTGRAAYAVVLKDWRFWAIAVGTMLAIGVTAGMLHLHPSAVGAGGGAVIGLVLATWVGRVKKCARCGAIAGPSRGSPG